jgi:uncharacterized protein (TIGR02246 family)
MAIPSRVGDILEIQALNARYNFSVDASDADAWADCFTRDGVFHALIEGHTPCGTEALRKFVPIVSAAFGQMNHLTTNELIAFDGEDAATQKCYLQFFTRKGGRLEGYICIYSDVLAREDGRWRYQDRKVAIQTKFADLQVGEGAG